MNLWRMGNALRRSETALIRGVSELHSAIRSRFSRAGADMYPCAGFQQRLHQLRLERQRRQVQRRVAVPRREVKVRPACQRQQYESQPVRCILRKHGSCVIYWPCPLAPLGVHTGVRAFEQRLDCSQPGVVCAVWPHPFRPSRGVEIGLRCSRLVITRAH
jgi:hypothetical protein